MPWLRLIKKPGAMPLLRGTTLSYEHLDPVEVLPDKFDPRSEGKHKHFVFVKISTTQAAALAEALTQDTLKAVGDVLPDLTRKRAYTLDTGAFTAREVASFADREAESIATEAKSISTAVKRKIAVGAIEIR